MNENNGEQVRPKCKHQFITLELKQFFVKKNECRIFGIYNYFIFGILSTV